MSSTVIPSNVVPLTVQYHALDPLLLQLLLLLVWPVPADKLSDYHSINGHHATEIKYNFPIKLHASASSSFASYARRATNHPPSPRPRLLLRYVAVVWPITTILVLHTRP